MQGYYRLVSEKNGTREVRVRRIFGVAFAYGTAQSPEPIVFLKPAEAIIWTDDKIRIPRGEVCLFEGELVIGIGREGRYIAAENALNYVASVGAGLDMTLARFQDDRANGRPWAVAKGFDTSACLSDFVPITEAPALDSLSVELDVNGERRQQAAITGLVTPIPNLVAWLSRFMTLLPGDLIFTGTPPGSAPVEAGDRLTVRVPGVAEATFEVAP